MTRLMVSYNPRRGQYVRIEGELQRNGGETVKERRAEIGRGPLDAAGKRERKRGMVGVHGRYNPSIVIDTMNGRGSIPREVWPHKRRTAITV